MSKNILFIISENVNCWKWSEIGQTTSLLKQYFLTFNDYFTCFQALE